MSSVRISAHIRDEIVNNVLAHKFAVDRSRIERHRAEIERLEAVRNRHGYEMVYSEKARKRLEEAPAGWYPTTNNVNVMVEDAGVDQVHFGEQRLVPYIDSGRGHENRNRVVAIVPADNPYFNAEQKVREARKELGEMESSLRTEERAASARIMAVLNSVTTTGRLLEVWPEVQQFLPEMVSSSSGGVPAEFIGDLNNFLNIGD